MNKKELLKSMIGALIEKDNTTAQKILHSYLTVKIQETVEELREMKNKVYVRMVCSTTGRWKEAVGHFSDSEAAMKGAGENDHSVQLISTGKWAKYGKISANGKFIVGTVNKNHGAPTGFAYGPYETKSIADKAVELYYEDRGNFPEGRGSDCMVLPYSSTEK